MLSAEERVKEVRDLENRRTLLTLYPPTPSTIWIQSFSHTVSRIESEANGMVE